MKTPLSALLILTSGLINAYSDESVNSNKITKGDLEVISVQLQTFEMISGRLPSSDEGLSALVTRPKDLKKWSQLLSSIPTDPWNHPYVYERDKSQKCGFTLHSLGKNLKDTQDDIIYVYSPPACERNTAEQGAAVNP
jgi:type II secretion system protein G